MRQITQHFRVTQKLGVKPQLNPTISRNPDFGANKKFLAHFGKTKPAGAKLYQHQQAVSYVTAEDDTKLEAKRRRQGWAFSLDSKQK